ncbi:MAG: glycosyltransferase family 4 protein [Ignavibacteria bacterium]|nr:glycosyltransferase family 4 protein [Ignavibacteria bacterium]MBT8383415.1 glycosyltransferase family 4 protein [Ignavibacteria bacterium]MBT8390246.1 glycosyltransferase family 4 protein [Ignavibacteria bacterium]NNJ52861.1 glycosyltransferase family 4 protein [Ignavibacteriaceae bacterium]NNL20899.1 glycosyltransferase family 4 protein [Ignavibacteriaceae bacterium]
MKANQSQRLINSSRKKVLFISYLFPPVAGGGVQRSSKFVKYLPQFGWQPLVLTVKEPYDFYSDDGLLKDVESNCKIYRTFSIEPMKWVRKLIKKRSQKETEQIKNKFQPKKTLKKGFLVKLKTYLFIPDNEILWLPFAVWRGWRIIRKEKPEIIYSSASPFTDHLIALILKIITRLPWAADFRDFWVDRANFPANQWRLIIDRKLEAIVFKYADQIITATPLMMEHFSKLYPDSKLTTITNGYDEDDFLQTENLKPLEKEFRITYTGIFNKEQNPQKFFSAVRKVLDQNEDFKKRIKLKFIGQLDNPGDFENLIFFKSLQLEEYSELVLYQPHKNVIEEMFQAKVLLLLIGEYPHSKGIFTGKIFEYLRSNRPILGVVPLDGVAADVLRRTNAGIVVGNNNSDKIAEGIIELFNLFAKNELEQSFRRKNIEEYNRKKLTSELADTFFSVVNEMNLR